MTLLFMACSKAPVKSGPIPQTLVIALDGVSYYTFKKMQDGGRFREFNPVSPMVATFPSISDPNWTTLFGMPPEVGFTKAFFNPTIQTKEGTGQEDGGLVSHITRQPIYEKKMHFKPEGAFEHFSTFVWLDTTARYWLDSLEKDFFAHRGDNPYFAFIVNTDIISHTGGEAKLLFFLDELEKKIELIRSKYLSQNSRNLEVILISDHGNAYVSPLEDVPFDGILKDNGWKLADTISGPKDVGYYVPELLSFGAFYCKPSSAKSLAQLLSKSDRVQSAAYSPSAKEVRVYHKKSEVQITVDETRRRVFYKVVQGQDIFNHAKYFRNGPVDFDTYFSKTVFDDYPYVAVRLWEGFHKNSQIRPEVLANAELGYVFGNKALRLLTDIKGFTSSHGSLHRDESLGLFASTSKPTLPIRPEDFRKHVNVQNFKK